MSVFVPTALRQWPRAARVAPSALAEAVAGAEYAAVFGPSGLVQEAKEGFIAARFSPSQPLRIKRTNGLRALQSISLPEPSNLFSYVMPWEPESLAA